MLLYPMLALCNVVLYVQVAAVELTAGRCMLVVGGGPGGSSQTYRGRAVSNTLLYSMYLEKKWNVIWCSC